MTARAPEDLATLLEPARAALDDAALVERSVRLARSRTLRAARGEVRGRWPERRAGPDSGPLMSACPS